jgi:cation transport protein ChaC
VLIPPNPDHEAMRERLALGTFLASLRANPPAGVRIRSDAELILTLSNALARHDPMTDLHVFGYGSLMWNPALDFVHARVVRVQGWHRRFCLRMLLGRGTSEAPGAMLGLDRGGACHGVLFRIGAAKVQEEMRLLWRREMLAGSYDARWVQAQLVGEGVPVPALTFVANRRHERYIGGRAIEDVANLIRHGSGPLGTSRAYFEHLLEALERLQIRDRGMTRLHQAILLADRTTA